jgi:hypothetical protein
MMRALFIIAALTIAGCDDAPGCPALPFNDLPCSIERQSCPTARGPCTCQFGVFDCPGEFPMVHDMAVPDLSLPAADLSRASD